jgi:hypothetical protein
MRHLRRALQRLAETFASARRERDLAEEIAAHIAMQTDDNLRAGMPPAQARREALLNSAAWNPPRKAIATSAVCRRSKPWRRTRGMRPDACAGTAVSRPSPYARWRWVSPARLPSSVS